MSRDNGLLAIALMIWGLGEGMFAIFQPLYLKQFGADAVLIGALLGGFGLAMALAQAPAGYLADRIGARPLLRAAWVLGLVSTILMAVAQSLPVFMAGLLLYGITAFVSSPMNAYVTEMRGSWSVARALTFNSALYSLGAVAGPTLGGWIADQWGLRSVYMLAVPVFLASTIVIFFLRAQPHRDHAAREAAPNLRSNGTYLRLLPVFFLMVLATYLPQTLTPNFLQAERGLSFSQIGQLGSTGSIGVVIIMLVMGNLAPLAGILIGMVGMISYAGLIWQGNGFGWYILAYFLSGGYRLIRTMIVAYTRPLVHPAQAGLAFGVIELVNGIALFSAPLLGGLIFQQQPSALYSVSLALIGLAFVIAVGVLGRGFPVLLKGTDQ